MTQDQTANTPLDSAAQPAGLQIQDWRIWYLFAGYVSKDVPDLRKAASRLLRAKLVRQVMVPKTIRSRRASIITKWEGNSLSTAGCST